MFSSEHIWFTIQDGFLKYDFRAGSGSAEVKSVHLTVLWCVCVRVCVCKNACYASLMT